MSNVLLTVGIIIDYFIVITYIIVTVIKLLLNILRSRHIECTIHERLTVIIYNHRIFFFMFDLHV